MSELPNGWALATLQELAGPNGLMDDGDWIESKDQDPDGDVRLIQLADIGDGHFIDKSKRYLTSAKATALRCTHLQPGDLLIARMPDPLGRSCIFPDIGMPSVTAVDVCIWRAAPDTIDARWLMHFVNSPEVRDAIQSQASGTTRQRVSGGNLKRLPVPVPPAQEQRRIVAKLDSLRARSARARQELDHIPKLIERYKQAILAKAFSGELTKDWREQHPCDASQFMTTTGIAVATNNAADPLPEGWCWAHAGEICAIKSGIALGKKRSADTQLVELPYLRVANVQRGWLDLSEIKTTLVTPREAEALYLQAGDVLMNEGGDRDKLGRGWVWEGEIKSCIHQNHVFRLRPKSSLIPSRYISYYANEFGQRYFLDEGKQTTNLASISMSKVSALPIPMCTPNEMKVIVQRIEAAFAWLDKIATEHARADHLLPKLDQAILAKAFRGELVPQDPNDEPASELLERIKAEREGADVTAVGRHGRRQKN